MLSEHARCNSLPLHSDVSRFHVHKAGQLQQQDSLRLPGLDTTPKCCCWLLTSKLPSSTILWLCGSNLLCSLMCGCSINARQCLAAALPFAGHMQQRPPTCMHRVEGSSPSMPK